MINKRLSLIVVGSVVAVTLLAAFVSLRRTVVPVHADRVVRTSISNTISTNGKIEPLQNFEAHAPAAVTVRRVLVQEGDQVKAGQLLLQLDDADARAQAARASTLVKAAQAGLTAVNTGGTHEEVLTTRSELVRARNERDAAQRNAEAMRRLLERGASSPAEVQEAENRLKTAQAQVTLLEQKQSARYSRPEVAKVRAELEEAQAAYTAAQEVLRNSHVRAPRDGMVYSLPVRQGAYVSAGDLLVQVADLSTVQVRGFVDEPEIGKLAKGQKVTVAWDALPGRLWEGTVVRVPSTVVTLGMRTVGQIICSVNNQDLKLLPNVNVNVTVLIVRHDNVLTVAREAIRQDDSKRYVYEIVSGELKRRDVQVAISSPTRIEVTSGLSDNARVALGAADMHSLKSGLPVRVVPR